MKEGRKEGRKHCSTNKQVEQTKRKIKRNKTEKREGEVEGELMEYRLLGWMAIMSAATTTLYSYALNQHVTHHSIQFVTAINAQVNSL